MPRPEDLPDDIAALKQIITETARDAATARAEIARLKFQLARYRRAEFGRSSEKLARETERLELTIEALETDQAERLSTIAPEAAAIVKSAAEDDAEIRELFWQWVAAERAVGAVGDADDDSGRLSELIEALSLRIARLPAQRPAGLAIKISLAERVGGFPAVRPILPR